MTKQPIFYTWSEEQAARGANEVSSALHDFLIKLQTEHVTEIRLFADGCGGQNKNSHVIHSLMFWLSNFAPVNIKKIILIFPVRGHTFLPADRVFGRVEKLLRSHSTILTKEKYNELYSDLGDVQKLGNEWTVFYFKSVTSYLNKVNDISEAKRIIIVKKKQSKVVIKAELYYRNNDPSQIFWFLLKRDITMISPEMSAEVALRHALKPEKRKTWRCCW